MVKDLGKKLDVYSAIVDKNKIEVIRLKSVVTKMVGMVCTRKDCTKRCSYSDKDLQDILDAVEFNTSNITITYNNKDE